VLIARTSSRIALLQQYSDLFGYVEAELLSLSALFFHFRHKDDFLHSAGEEDGVCWGDDLRKNTVVFEHGCCVF